MESEESALEVLRVTSKRAWNLMSWGRPADYEEATEAEQAKTAEAKALYEDLLPRMERELVR